MFDKAPSIMPPPNGRSPLQVLHFVFLLTAVLTVVWPAWAESEVRPTRPIMRIVLKRNGATIEGTLARFGNGAYTLDVGGRLKIIAEGDIRSITFRSPKAARNESDINQLVAQLSKSAREHARVAPAIVTALAKKGAGALEPLLAAVGKDSSIYQSVGEVFRQMDHSVQAKLIDAVRNDGRHGVKLSVWWMFRGDGVACAGAMAKLLDDPNPVMRKFALDTLYGVGIQAGNDLPAWLAGKLIRSIRDADRNVQKQAVSVLARLHPASDAVVPALLRELSAHPEPSTRRQIVIALGSVQHHLKRDDPRLKQILGALSTALLKDCSASVRSSAAMRLALMGARAEAALPAVRRALDDPSASVRHYAREAQDFITSNATNPMRLRHYDPRRDDNSGSPRERAQLERRLAACDRKTAALVRQLIGRGGIRSQEARRKLAGSQPGEPLIEALMAAVRADKYNAYWNVIAYVMAAWGEQILPQLDRYASDEHFRVRRTVVVAWGKMKLRTLPKKMAPMVCDRHVWVRLSAAQSLTKLTRNGSRELVKSAVVLLVKSMQDEEIQRTGWWNGASAMADLAPSYPETINALIKAMRSAKRESLRGSAARSLGHVGLKLREGNKTVGRIVEALRHRLGREPVERTRATIIRALGYMRKRAAAALPELRKASDDPSERVSKAAREALAKIAK